MAVLYGVAALFEIADDFRHYAFVPSLVALALLVGGCLCGWRAAHAEGQLRRRLGVAGIVAFALGVLQAGLWWLALHAAVAAAAVLAWRTSRARGSRAGRVSLRLLSVALVVAWLALLLVAVLLALWSEPT